MKELLKEIEELLNNLTIIRNMEKDVLKEIDYRINIIGALAQAVKEEVGNSSVFKYTNI